MSSLTTTKLWVRMTIWIFQNIFKRKIKPKGLEVRELIPCFAPGRMLVGHQHLNHAWAQPSGEAQGSPNNIRMISYPIDAVNLMNLVTSIKVTWFSMLGSLSGGPLHLVKVTESRYLYRWLNPDLSTPSDSLETDILGLMENRNHSDLKNNPPLAQESYAFHFQALLSMASQHLTPTTQQAAPASSAASNSTTFR